jgi:hypothetical protein
MIQLHSDCLVFEVPGGDKIPCSVEKLTIEVLAESVELLDPEVIQHAAAAVLHYFRRDLGRETVTVAEFTAALEDVLRGLGFDISSDSAKPQAARVANADLARLAERLGEGLELEFYAGLRDELRSLLAGDPALVRFHGLRPCAKRLARVRRWCPRSIQVSEEIVEFLRKCWGAERPPKSSALVVN